MGREERVSRVFSQLGRVCLGSSYMRSMERLETPASAVIAIASRALDEEWVLPRRRNSWGLKV